MSEHYTEGDLSSVGTVVWVGDDGPKAPVEAAGVEAVTAADPSALRTAAEEAAICVLAGDPPPALRSTLSDLPVPVVAYVDAPPADAPAVADDFVRRSADVDRLLDRLAWHGTDTDGPRDDRPKVEQLHDIATELLACPDEDAVYDLVVEAAERVLEFDICTVDAVEDGSLVPKAVSEGIADDGYQAAPVDEGGLAGEAYRTGDPSLVDDIRESAAADPAVETYRSVLTVPIGERAVFQAGSTAVGAFDETDLELAELLAAHAEGTLHRIRSEAAVRRRNETIERLHDIVGRMVGCESEAAVYDLLVDAAEEVLEFSVCLAISDDPDGEDLVVRAASDDDLAPEPGAVVPPDRGMTWHTYRTGEASLTRDVEADDIANPHQDSYRSGISVPMGEVGVVQAISLEVDAFDEHDLEMAELLASQAGAVVTQLRAETRLRSERDRLRALFEHIPDPAVRFAVDDDPVVQDVNSAFETVFGYDAEDVVGTELDDAIVPPADRETATELNRRIHQGESFHQELRRVTADGERRHFIGHAVPTDRSGDNVVGYAIYTDITERKRREQRLAALNRTTRELLGATDAGAVCEITVEAARKILDLPVTGVFRREEGRLALAAASAAAWDMFDGPPPTFEPGHDVWDAFESGDPSVIDDVDPASLVEDAPVEAVMVLPLGEYGVVVSAGRGTETFDEGTRDLAGVLAANVEAALARAERERRLRDRERELERQNDRLEEFASVVSHDLRTPLSVARGHLDLARQEVDNDNLSKVADAHARMDALIDDLLSLAHEGRVVGETEPVPLDAAASDAWGVVGTDESTLDIAGSVTLDADPDRLVQLLENLFRNAVEHAGPAVTVEVGPLEGGAHVGGFYVEDDGPGIPAADRDDVFERGYTTAEDGTGFGLAIVGEIATAHGWSVSVTDGADGGARFEIRVR